MAVQSTLQVRLQFSDNGFNNFDSGQVNKSITTMTQRFAADVLVPDGAADLIISLQGIQNAQQLYFWSSEALSLKLVPYGGVLASTVPLVLMPGVPSVIAVQNIVQIAISNGTGAQARFVLQGAGV